LIGAEKKKTAFTISEELLTYIFVFIIPLSLRLVPELHHYYPLGVDTPRYMYIMQFRKLMDEYAQTNAFYNLLVFLRSIGVNAMEFFKIYPAATFALNALLMSTYLKRRLGWDLRSLLIFSVTYSFVPALLRTSHDLHRQSFALLLLSLALVLTTFKWGWKVKTITLSIVYILTGLTHEMVFAVAIFIQLWITVKSLLRKSLCKEHILQFLIIVVPVSAYIIIRPKLFLHYLEGLIIYGYQPLGINFVSGWERFDWFLSVGLLSYGFILPLAVMGRFSDDHLTPWVIASIVPYLSFAISYISFNMPDRWLYLAAIPASIYAANFLRRFTLKDLSLYFLLTILVVQPLSMLGLTPQPISLYAEKRYGTFTDLISTPVPEDYIKALQLYSERADRSNNFILIVPYELKSWADYFFPDGLVISSDNPAARNAINSPSVIYISYGNSSLAGFTLKFSYGGLNFYGKP
jgi:hypothetical protein